MGFRFRRSLKLLPGVRLNLSGRGASVSLGGRGLTYNLGARGSRVTVGIPGTGVSWSSYTPHASNSSGERLRAEPTGQPLAPAANGDALTPIESAPIEQVNARSTSEIAPILNSAHRRIRLAPLVFFVSMAVFIAVLSTQDSSLIGVAALYAAISMTASIYLDRYRRSVRLEYEYQSLSQKIATAIEQTFSDIQNCSAAWNITAEGATSDWKKNAGATRLNKRKSVRPQFRRPACIRGGIAFANLPLGRDDLFFLPDAALLVRQSSVAALHYKDIEISLRPQRFIEEEGVPRDSEVVGQTWRYVNRSGAPDRRFNDNKQVPICLYGEMDFVSAGGLNAKVHLSNAAAGERFEQLLQIFKKRLPSGAEGIVKSVHVAQRWPTVVFCTLFFVVGGAIGWQAKPAGMPMTASTSIPRPVVSPIKSTDSVAAPEAGRESAASSMTTQPIAAPSTKAAATVPLPKPRPGPRVEQNEFDSPATSPRRNEYFTPD